MRCKRVSTRFARFFHVAHVLYSTSERHARGPIGHKSVGLASKIPTVFRRRVESRVLKVSTKCLAWSRLSGTSPTSVCDSSRDLAKLHCGESGSRYGDQFTQDCVSYVNSDLISPAFLRQVQSVVGARQQITKRHFFSPITSSDSKTCRKRNRLTIQISLLVGEVCS